MGKCVWSLRKRLELMLWELSILKGQWKPLDVRSCRSNTEDGQEQNSEKQSPPGQAEGSLSQSWRRPRQKKMAIACHHHSQERKVWKGWCGWQCSPLLNGQERPGVRKGLVRSDLPEYFWVQPVLRNHFHITISGELGFCSQFSTPCVGIRYPHPLPCDFAEPIPAVGFWRALANNMLTDLWFQMYVLAWSDVLLLLHESML